MGLCGVLRFGRSRCVVGGGKELLLHAGGGLLAVEELLLEGAAAHHLGHGTVGLLDFGMSNVVASVVGWGLPKTT
jgi:hypothetical protein